MIVTEEDHQLARSRNPAPEVARSPLDPSRQGIRPRSSLNPEPESYHQLTDQACA